jgi:hypothetical protein
VRASSEAEPHSRGRPSLERGGNSLEGRPVLERGGTLPEGRPALERGEVSFVRCRAPRVKQSFARGGLGLTVLVDRWGRRVHRPRRWAVTLCVMFCESVCVILGKKWIFPGRSGTPKSNSKRLAILA